MTTNERAGSSAATVIHLLQRDVDALIDLDSDAYAQLAKRVLVDLQKSDLPKIVSALTSAQRADLLSLASSALAINDVDDDREIAMARSLGEVIGKWSRFGMMLGLSTLGVKDLAETLIDIAQDVRQGNTSGAVDELLDLARRLIG